MHMGILASAFVRSTWAYLCDLCDMTGALMMIAVCSDSNKLPNKTSQLTFLVIVYPGDTCILTAHGVCPKIEGQGTFVSSKNETHMSRL